MIMYDKVLKPIPLFQKLVLWDANYVLLRAEIPYEVKFELTDHLNVEKNEKDEWELKKLQSAQLQRVSIAKKKEPLKSSVRVGLSITANMSLSQ